VITGGVEIKASTVKRVAPFAYEPFLKLMGEHPSMISSRMAAKKNVSAEPESDSGVATIAGFRPEELSVKIDGVDSAVLEPVVPVKEKTPVEKPEPPPQEKQKIDEDVPVG